MTQVDCRKCGADISESYQPDDPSVGVVGGWYCEVCDLGVGEHEIDRDPLEGDITISPEPRPMSNIGTPLSEISGRPGEKGYVEFVRIARSWGFD